MAKLGYTWYPKDWGNSESVFELSLSERGLYREFIDLAMLNDNTTEIKKDVWIRKFCVSKEDLEFILCKLISLNLIEFRENILFIPSCESRLKLVRGGSNGGKKSKPTTKPNIKPTSKPFVSLDEKKQKPTTKQIEIETKREIEIETFSKENITEFLLNDLENSTHLELVCKKTELTLDQVKAKIPEFKKVANIEYVKPIDLVMHFIRWLKLNPPKDINSKPKMSW